MAKPGWGRKHRCHSCATRFYDLRREPAVCPRCGAEVAPAESKQRCTAPKPKAPDPEPRGPKLVAIEMKDEVDKVGDPIEDASELGEDDQDVAAVIAHDTEKQSEAM